MVKKEEQQQYSRYSKKSHYLKPFKESHYPKKSQASVEYLMVAGLAFLIIVPMIYLLYSYTSDVSSEVTDQKINRIATDIVNAAETVWYLGEPSKTTLRVDMPEGVIEVRISEEKDLNFFIGDPSSPREITKFSTIPLVSLLTPEDVAPGRHNIRF